MTTIRNIPLALYLEISHERLLHQYSSLGHLELGKSREIAFQLLPCNHVMQQAVLATYPTGQQEEKNCHFS